MQCSTLGMILEGLVLGSAAFGAVEVHGRTDGRI